jgi:hypothetical protein
MGLTFTSFRLEKLAVNSASSFCKLSDEHALQGIPAPETSKFNPPLEAFPGRYYHTRSSFFVSGASQLTFVATGSLASSDSYFSIAL